MTKNQFSEVLSVLLQKLNETPKSEGEDSGANKGGEKKSILVRSVHGVGRFLGLHGDAEHMEAMQNAYHHRKSKSGITGGFESSPKKKSGNDVCTRSLIIVCLTQKKIRIYAKGCQKSRPPCRYDG